MVPRKSRDRVNSMSPRSRYKNVAKLIRFEQVDAEFLGKQASLKGISEAQFIRDLVADFRQGNLFKEKSK